MRQLYTLLFVLVATFLAAQTDKRAEKEFDLGDFGQAANSYLKVVEKNPADGVALTRLADCYLMMNRLNEAENWYKKALAVPGSPTKARLQLGHVLKSLGKYDAARVEYEKYALSQPAIGKHFAASCDFAKKMMQAASPFVVKPEYFNTRENEFNPAFFGDLVFFNAMPPRNLPEHASGKYTNLLVSSLDQNNYLKVPTAFSDELHANTKIGPIAYDTENHQVFYTINNFKSTSRPIPAAGLEMVMYHAKLNGDGTWIDAQPFAFNGSGYSSGYPSISPDGKTLYFASDRPDGYGGWDIYVSRKIGGTWTRPENLGPLLNTPGDEISPFYDGRQLYFSSDWHPGLGGFDIFRANKEVDQWNKIFHLGNQANSPKDDLGYVYSPSLNIGYICSNRSGGKGNMDFYQLQRQTDQIVIQVKDADGNPVPDVVIDFSKCGEASYRTNLSGLYSFQALGGFNCQAVIGKSGFMDQMVDIRADGSAGQKKVDIILSREARKIPGTIVLAGNNAPVANVLVRATDQRSGEVLETYSDAGGNYGLPLKSNTTYVVRFSKVGFSDTHKKITTEGIVQNDLLGVLPFEEVYASTASTGGNTSGGATSSSSSNTTSSGPPPSGQFSIQLAATSNADAINLAEFSGVEGREKLYIVTEKGLTKVRLGNFASRAAAAQSLANCKKQGFTQSFIVAGASAPPSTASTPITKPVEDRPVIIDTPAPRPTSAPAPVVSGSNNKYKIRLATYQNTSYFKPEKILAYGSIEKVKKGKMTVMLLASFDTLAEAKQVLPKIRAAGFTTAHIVLDENGNWQRMK